jgi:hypothetical protein
MIRIRYAYRFGPRDRICPAGFATLTDVLSSGGRAAQRPQNATDTVVVTNHGSAIAALPPDLVLAADNVWRASLGHSYFARLARRRARAYAVCMPEG